MRVVFALTWSVVLLSASRSATSRILAARVSLLTSLIAGGSGIRAGWAAAQTFAKGLKGIGADVVFAFCSSLAALVVASAVSWWLVPFGAPSTARRALRRSTLFGPCGRGSHGPGAMRSASWARDIGAAALARGFAAVAEALQAISRARSGR